MLEKSVAKRHFLNIVEALTMMKLISFLISLASCSFRPLRQPALPRLLAAAVAVHLDVLEHGGQRRRLHLARAVRVVVLININRCIESIIWVRHDRARHHLI